MNICTIVGKIVFTNIQDDYAIITVKSKIIPEKDTIVECFINSKFIKNDILKGSLEIGNIIGIKGYIDTTNEKQYVYAEKMTFLSHKD